MKESVAIVVNASRNGDEIKRYRKVVTIETEFGGYHEVNAAVNKVVNKDFPFGTYAIVTSSWNYV